MSLNVRHDMQVSLWIAAHVQTNHCSLWQGADLDEVAQLVREPEGSGGREVLGGAFAVGEGLVKASFVLDLTNQGRVLQPDPQDAAPAAMPDAVGGDFIEGGDELGSARRSQPGGLRMTKDEPARGGKPIRAKGFLPDIASSGPGCLPFRSWRPPLHSV